MSDSQNITTDSRNARRRERPKPPVFQSGDCVCCPNCGKSLPSGWSVAQTSLPVGYSKWSEFKIWTGIRDRCRNSNNTSYYRYGGRGIDVCDRWAHSFESFFNDMGRRPSPKHTLDRIDNDRNYSPDNCRWATVAEQAQNQRKSLTQYIIDGEQKTLREWAECYGISFKTLEYRIYGKRMSLEVALRSPISASKSPRLRRDKSEVAR